MASRPSSPLPGWKIILPIPIFASSRCARCARIRFIERGIFRARCGCIGNRHVGMNPIANSSRPQQWRKCSAAWASARSRPLCCTEILFSTAVTRSGPSLWQGTRTCGCSTAGAGNGSTKSVRRRRPCRAFPLLLIQRRRERRRCGLAAAMCATIEAAGAAAGRYAFAGGIFGRTRVRIFLQGRSLRRAHRANSWGGPSLFQGTVERDDLSKSPDQLRGVLAAVGIAPEKYDDVVCYCRRSHRATIGWIALSQILGHTNAKIYDGSWTEWGSIVGYPIEK